ncbi:hypothetical protein B7463_g1901, partial [Scytalidium lignicola]
MYDTISISSSSSDSEPPPSPSSTVFSAGVWLAPVHKRPKHRSTSDLNYENDRHHKAYKPRPDSFHQHAPTFFWWPYSSSRKSSHRPVSTPDYFNLQSFSSSSDLQLWRYMLSLQKVYDCYHSARMSAAVDELEKGVRIQDMDIPSRTCLNLLNQELRAQMDLAEHGYKL